MTHLQANRVPGTDPGERRHLSSSSETLSAFRRFSDDATRVESYDWPGVRLISVGFSAAGSLPVPGASFYSYVMLQGAAPGIRLRDRAGGERVLSAGRSLICGTGQSFDYAWSSAHRASWICLDAELVHEIAADCGVDQRALRGIGLRPEAGDSTCDYLASILEHEARAGASALQAITVAAVSKALACRLVERSTRIRLAPTSPRGSLGIRAFERVCAYIAQNLDARISLSDLAEVAGISRFHFARQFRLRTGESPLGYVLRTRIEHARLLLRERGLRISDIAARLGFSDQSHFTRTFKRIVGMPPSRYAQLHSSEAGPAARPDKAGTIAQITPRRRPQGQPPPEIHPCR